MRRLIVLTVVTALGGLFLPAAPASATDSETVYYDAPQGWGVFNGDCPNGGGTPNSFSGAHYGPGDPPYGTGSVQLSASAGQLTGPGTTYNTFSNLDAMAAIVWETTGSRFEFRIDVVTDSGYRTLIWAPNPTEGEWVLVQPDFASTQWSIYETGTTNYLGTTTVDSYQTTWGTKNWSPAFVSAGCSASSTVYLDALLLVATNTVDRIYDFEAQPTSLTMVASASTLTFGQKVTLKTHGSWLGSPFYEGAPIQLWAKPSGKSFAKIATVAADASGNASKIVAPRVGTTYQWRFPSQGANQPSQSPTKAVGVRAKVTAELLDESVRKGQRLVVVGKVTPDKGGVRATFYRDSATGQIKLGSALVRSDGTYRIASGVISTAGSQTWKVYVKVPAEGGNLAGKSPVLTAHIN